MPVFKLWSDSLEWTQDIPAEIQPADAEVLTLLLNESRRRGMLALEVGSWVGNGSTRVIVEALRGLGGTLYCVDTWAGSDNVDHHREYRKHFPSMFQVFADNVSKYDARRLVRPLRMPSLEASRLFPDESIDFLFIDGNHSYSEVKQDILAWLPKVKAGGILCGHDCDASYEDLDPKLWPEVDAHCEEDVIANPFNPRLDKFHPGVLKAVTEVLGGKATLWCRIRPPASIWSYEKPGRPTGRFRALVRKHGPFFRTSLSGNHRPLVTPTPWPDCPAERAGDKSLAPLPIPNGVSMPPACPQTPDLVGTHEGYRLVRHGGSFHGIPPAAGPVDLDVEEECRRAGVVRGQTREEVRERIDRVRSAVPVEFAGWLPVFVPWGNCGRHPQFKHTASPPPGYQFTCSARPPRSTPSLWGRSLGRLLGWAARGVGRLWNGLARVLGGLRTLVRTLVSVFRSAPGVALRDRFRVLAAVLRLFFTLRRGGAALGPILHFLKSRHYQSQLLLAHYRGLVFLPSMPYTYGQNPWVVEIEDPITLFLPFIQNGHTRDLCFRESPYFLVVKTFLESDSCKGIITHMKSTAEMVRTLFASQAIRDKVFYTPLGVPIPERCQSHEESDEINLLFINSWHQLPGNFFLRGGLDVLEAFDVLRRRYPQLRLTLRTSLPGGLDIRYGRILMSRRVRIIDRFLSATEMGDLLAGSHIFLLPAARVHIVSLLQAMAHGLAVVASDGWGFGEYVTHKRNALVVKGRYGKVSWVDEEAGILREDYQPMYQSDPRVVRGLVAAVSRLVEDRALRQRLGRTARQDVETTYNLERWNQGLKAAFDRARSPALAGWKPGR